MQEHATFQLVMRAGPRPGQAFELPRSTVSIGRDPGNQVSVDDPQVSRQHARITPQGGLMVLEDLGSTNGTIVNGLRISAPHTLAHGDKVGLGDNVVLVFYGSPASESGDTVVAPRSAYTDARAPASAPPPTLMSSSRPVYEEVLHPANPLSDLAYDQPVAPDDVAYSAYYDEYAEDTDRNWTLIGLGCILIAIVTGLLIAFFIYFFAPASIVDPIADFLAGLGISVP